MLHPRKKNKCADFGPHRSIGVSCVKRISSRHVATVPNPTHANVVIRLQVPAQVIATVPQSGVPGCLVFCFFATRGGRLQLERVHTFSSRAGGPYIDAAVDAPQYCMVSHKRPGPHTRRIRVCRGARAAPKLGRASFPCSSYLLPGVFSDKDVSKRPVEWKEESLAERHRVLPSAVFASLSGGFLCLCVSQFENMYLPV